MTAFVRAAAVAALVAPVLLAASPAAAAGSSSINVRLEGKQEVPAISTVAKGDFHANVSPDGTEIEYRLRYQDLEGDVTQAHLHIAQKSVNGRIFVFLCTNLGNGPAGTQACPPAPATITGTIRAVDVLDASPPGPPANQGIAAGEFDELLAAIRAGIVYVNVHSSDFPGGEIRAQLKRSHRHHD